ncbi:MAG: hypothetical protein A2666_03945 [Parcubacteria group bacterium RIFCSPHIGHO2_01_FULL_47_10b]|nr:MAG: hypothetical protein A2666_03945 [Parcubacteria group bacterium RIFCSPHIGHO2_01_FULL_47_10b]
MVSLDELHKLDVRIGTVRKVELIEGADRLYKLTVDFGADDPARQIVSGIREYYTIKQLEGAQLPFILNLEPRRLKGVDSNGMLLAVSVDGAAVLLKPRKKVPEGSKVI